MYCSHCLYRILWSHQKGIQLLLKCWTESCISYHVNGMGKYCIDTLLYDMLYSRIRQFSGEMIASFLKNYSNYWYRIKTEMK